MKKCLYVIVLFLLIIPVAGQKNIGSWRDACLAQCGDKYNTCRREANGDGPKKEQCEIKYRSCKNWCYNPPRKG